MQCESNLNTTRTAEMGGEEGAVGLHVILPQVVLGVAIDDDVPCSLKHQLSPISLLFFFFLTPYFLFSFHLLLLHLNIPDSRVLIVGTHPEIPEPV
ncbi:hypothetical protein I7I50_09821 [Histoplasma capsulatum G186AR]|uniref:Uncharacterized protein n=1 Tax=Ajellomyces capsulatus TaxID=5037 RepID=A0A8H7YYD4_AJECA|nr:hypothetical protein I7I52_10862 [Histoplasma capsulatum]QSS68749.1 hypothetical protein I7I50_09821 [Histoplasma capsulatum G186AR]